MCPHCHRYPREDCLWWVSTGHEKKRRNWWCAACGQFHWRDPNTVSIFQDGADPNKAKVFPRISCVLSSCLANQQTVGGSLVDTIVESLQEQSRMKITNELRRFIEVDNREAVKIGDLEKDSEAIKVDKPKFNKEIHQNAAIWDAALLHQHHQCEGQQMGPPLVDEDWHAVLSSHPHGPRRSGMGELVQQARGDEQRSQRPPSKWKHQCKTLWKIRHARESCDAYND